MSFIRDVLVEILFKKMHDNLYKNQQIVANSLSKNKFNDSIEKKTLDKITDDLFYKIRSIYDFKALKERYKDKKIYSFYCPSDEYEKKLFEIFSACRCIKLGFQEFVGCKKNIKKNIHNPNLFFDYELDKKNLFLFKTILDLFENKKVNSQKLKIFFPEVSKTELKKLNKLIFNQELYFIKAKEIINLIQKDLNETKNHPFKSEDQNGSKKESSQKKKLKTIPFTDKIKKKQSNQNENKSSENLLKNKDSITDKYKVFTKEFDLSVNAKYLASKSELNYLRKKFENEYFENKRLINKLAKKLERLFSSLNTNSWKFDQDEGHIDPSRLANLVANSKNLQIFKRKNENTEKNTVVSLLLDNSGSMRGKPIITSAITTEIITKVLEKCKVNVEILGFTTREWKGGKSKKKWETAGKIEWPGRLNDLLHIIYKDADSTWNNCKNNLGLILKDGLLKENIDGEAVKWAYKRLISRKEKKKILIVISDGAPVDDSTLSNNPPDILDIHLKKTVDEIQKTKSINLVAIGIGHDVSKYYKNAFVIDEVENLGDIIIENLMKFLGTKNS